MSVYFMLLLFIHAFSRVEMCRDVSSIPSFLQLPVSHSGECRNSCGLRSVAGRKATTCHGWWNESPDDVWDWNSYIDPMQVTRLGI